MPAAPEMSSRNPPDGNALMGVYLLVEPTVAGKVVLDVGPRPTASGERLRLADAEQVVEADALPLPMADGQADVIVCVARLGSLAGDVQRHQWLTELRRVLAP